MALRRQTFQQQSDATTESLIAAIKPRDELAVRRYLSEHRDLVPYIATVTQLVREVFGDDARGIVASVQDWDETEPYLSLGIETALASREAIDRLHALDAQWFELVDQGVRDRILVTLART